MLSFKSELSKQHRFIKLKKQNVKTWHDRQRKRSNKKEVAMPIFQTWNAACALSRIFFSLFVLFLLFFYDSFSLAYPLACPHAFSLTCPFARPLARHLLIHLRVYSLVPSLVRSLIHPRYSCIFVYKNLTFRSTRELCRDHSLFPSLTLTISLVNVLHIDFTLLSRFSSNLLELFSHCFISFLLFD